MYSPYGYETAARAHTFSFEGPGNMQVSCLHEDICREATERVIPFLFLFITAFNVLKN